MDKSLPTAAGPGLAAPVQGLPDPALDGAAPPLRALLNGRSVVLVGLMGAGKTTIGRRLASRLGLPFRDADVEIEAAAGMPISDIFARYGEPAFRDGERRVIDRLLGGEPLVLATGGGAYMDPQTRERIGRAGISIWLKADLGTLLQRVSRRNHRPLLRGTDPAETLRRLMAERDPVYALADLTVASSDLSHGRVTEDVYDALLARLAATRSGW